MTENAQSELLFELVETTGELALSTWEELRTAGRGVPLILGGDASFASTICSSPLQRSNENVAEILRIAARLKYPDDLIRKRAKDHPSWKKWFKRHLDKNPSVRFPKIIPTSPDGTHGIFDRYETIAALLFLENKLPDIGQWPATVHPSRSLTFTSDHSGKPAHKVYIALIPTDDWTTIPALLEWGGWNACPAPEYQVAALRSWRDRFGAELVGFGGDTLSLRVARRPQTNSDALDLAREQYWYCNDTIDQGAGTLSAEAASLMANDWWNFWWD